MGPDMKKVLWERGAFLFFSSKHILLIILSQLSHFFLPLSSSAMHPPPTNIPALSSCPWVIHISTLASPFPILFLTSPVNFVPDKYAS